MESTQEVFESAVNVVRNMPKEGPFKPSDELKLKFYAYFKQATHGLNDTPKPRFYDVVNIYKWNAWKKLGNMPKEEAKLAYINELRDIVQSIPISDEDRNTLSFNNILGPFYDYCLNHSSSSLTTKVKQQQLAAHSSPSYNNNNNEMKENSSDGHVSNSKSNRNNNENLLNGNGHLRNHNNDNIKINGNGLNSIASRMVGPTNNGISTNICPIGNAQSSNLPHRGSSNNSDSDDSNSEFCDTYNHDEIDHMSLSDYAATEKNTGSDPWSIVTTIRGGHDGPNRRPHQQAHRQQQVASGGDRSGRESHNRGSNNTNLSGMESSSGDSGEDGGRNPNIYSTVAQEISDQLALAVLRLQYSMEHVIQRLDSIEARITSAEKRQSSINSSTDKSKSSHTSNRTTTIIFLTWPILVYFVCRAIEKRQQNQSK